MLYDTRAMRGHDIGLVHDDGNVWAQGIAQCIVLQSGVLKLQEEDSLQRKQLLGWTSKAGASSFLRLSNLCLSCAQMTNYRSSTFISSFVQLHKLQS